MRKQISLFEVLVFVAIVGIVVAMIMTYAQKKEFMRECLRDHKAYECEVLWQQSQPDRVHVYHH